MRLHEFVPRHGEAYNRIVAQNLQRQASLLRDSVELGLLIDFKVDLDLILALNAACTTYLVERPGAYRTQDCHVTYSAREFPSTTDVPGLMTEMIITLHQQWHEADALWLACFLLWRMTWIHPFEDGNGRTARAAAMYVINVKFGRWLPGRIDAMQLIKQDHQRYFKGLQHADETHARGAVDLRPLQDMLLDALELQVSSAKRPITKRKRLRD